MKNELTLSERIANIDKRIELIDMLSFVDMRVQRIDPTYDPDGDGMLKDFEAKQKLYSLRKELVEQMNAAENKTNG